MKFKKSLTTKNILNPEKSIAMKQEETMKGQTNGVFLMEVLFAEAAHICC